MSRVADTYNNPFKLDSGTVPPMRSALAILNAEHDELDEPGIEAILERALRTLREDPEIATVYGQAIEAEDLRDAALKLTDPANRALAKLLDFTFQRFELGEVTELREAVSDYRDRLCEESGLEVTDFSLLGALLQRLCRDVKIPTLEAAPLDAPDVPSLEDLLQDIA